MDPLTLIIIATIVVVIFALDLYKRQKEKITSNLHSDNLRQMLTISALEYKFGADDIEDEPQSTINEITDLISCFGRGEIQAEAFHNQMDCLLNKM